MTIRLVCSLTLLSLALAAAQTPGPAPAPVFRPGHGFPDTDGKELQARGGGMLYDKGTYYFYGEHKVTIPQWNNAFRTKAILAYSSRDLYAWKNHGNVLAGFPVNPAKFGIPTDSTLLGRFVIIERPKVLFNAKTRKYVMWMHLEDAPYKAAMTGVAVADHPAGPFKMVDTLRLNGEDNRDMTLYQDDDGRAYHIHASEGNMRLHITPLSDDYLQARDTSKAGFSRYMAGKLREAPCVLKWKGKYYLFTSGTSGFSPNKTSIAVADSMMGAWKELNYESFFGKNTVNGMDSGKTWGFQPTYIQKVMDRKDAYILVLDQWNTANHDSGRTAFLPIELKEDKIRVQWRSPWDLSFFGGLTTALRRDGQQDAGNPKAAAPRPETRKGGSFLRNFFGLPDPDGRSRALRGL